MYFSVSPAIGDLAYQTYATVPSAHVADVKRELRDGSLSVLQRVRDPPSPDSPLKVAACIRAHLIFSFCFLVTVGSCFAVFLRRAEMHIVVVTQELLFFPFWEHPSFLPSVFFLFSVSCVNASRLSLSEKGFSHRFP